MQQEKRRYEIDVVIEIIKKMVANPSVRPSFGASRIGKWQKSHRKIKSGNSATTTAIHIEIILSSKAFFGESI